MRNLVVLPTYRELRNLVSLVPEILARVDGVDVLVVDDNSGDGTAEFLKYTSRHESRLFYLIRDQKAGLGSAYVDGFRWALRHGYENIAQMDADYSHRITDLQMMFEAKGAHDFVIGSRRVYGSRTLNWSRSRRLLSWIANQYVNFFLGPKISDWTGGFNIWSAKVLNSIELDATQARGFIFQADIKFRALKLNFSAIEVPIIFEERREGQSKMSFRIIAEGLAHVWRLGSIFSHSS